MTNALAITDKNHLAILENIVFKGDLSGLTNEQILLYNQSRCQSLGVDENVGCFAVMLLQGKKTLYPTKELANQLIAKRGLSVDPPEGREILGGKGWLVAATVRRPDGSSVSNIGTVPLTTEDGKPMRVTDQCNAILKCTTKAIRRAVFTACGLGGLDETEIETIPGAKTESLPSVSVEAPQGSGESTADLWARCKDLMADVFPELAGLKNQDYVKGLVTLLPEGRQAEVQAQGAAWKPTREDVMAGIAALVLQAETPDPFESEVIEGEAHDA